MPPRLAVLDAAGAMTNGHMGFSSGLPQCHLQGIAAPILEELPSAASSVPVISIGGLACLLSLPSFSSFFSFLSFCTKTAVVWMDCFSYLLVVR